MKKVSALGILALLVASVASTAAAAGSLSGVLKSSDGAPFRAGFVRAQNTKSKVTFMVLSDKQGHYFVDKLPAGTYNVSASAIGYKSDPMRRTDITVEDSKDTNLGFT